MKKLLMAAAAITLMMTMTMLTSCTSEDDSPITSPEPEQLADYTILFYGNGGASLDEEILENLTQFYQGKTESYEHVNIVAQYKFSTEECLREFKYSTPEADKNYGSQSIRFVVEHDADKTYKNFDDILTQDMIYGEKNADLSCTDSLTNFINWAARTYPAKRYILVMADHGGGYLPNHDLPESAITRGLVFDDGYQNGNTIGNQHKCFSGKSFARAVKNADIRIDGIIPYLCLMNNLEFLYEVKDVTDYIACSTYTLWGTIGAMQSLPDNLAAGLDTKTALVNFVDANVDSWDKNLYDPANPEEPNYYDMTLTETKRLDDLAPVLKEFTDRLVDTYQNGTAEQRAAIDECTANAVKVYNQFPLYDMAKYMESLFLVLPDVFNYALYNRFADAFNACIAHQRYARYLTNHNYQVDYSMILAVRGHYIYYVYDLSDTELQTATVYYTDGTTETYQYVTGDGDSSSGSLDHYVFQESGTWPSTFADTYQQTTFDRLVGWSRWLLLNETAPPAWSPSSFCFKLPSDDMSGIPTL